MSEIEWAQTLDKCQDPADYAYCACKIYSCGYSQPNRTHISAAWLKSSNAEVDCSSLVNWCLYMGDFLNENIWFHTAIERAYLAEHGFEIIDANASFVKMQRNDVLLRERNDARGVTGHTALYIGDGLQAEALRTERHDAGYDGSTPGDQDNGETVVRPLTYDWDYVIRKIDQPNPTSRRLVLDIYHGNKGIDLASWKAKHGLWAVIPKCGGSEDKCLNRFEETTFNEHVTQARQLGLHVGAYYYSDALTVEDALLDAKHCVNKCLAGTMLDMPVYLDIEEPAQLKKLNMRQLTDIVVTFCDYVRQAGYMPGIYSGYDGFHNMYEDEIKDYALWAASWRFSWPLWAKDYGMWQQGSMRLSDGDIQYDDVPGYIDVNWCQIDYPSIIDKETIMPKTKMGFYAFDSDPTEHFFDGQHLHAIANLDEKRAIIDFFALNGIKLDPIPKPFGTDTAPFGARLNDVLSRGAEFRGFERFNSHPSTKKIVLDIVTNAVKTVTTNIKAMLEKK